MYNTSEMILAKINKMLNAYKTNPQKENMQILPKYYQYENWKGEYYLNLTDIKTIIIKYHELFEAQN